MLFATAVSFFVEKGKLSKAKRPFPTTKLDLRKLQDEGQLQPSKTAILNELVRQWTQVNKRLAALVDHPVMREALQKMDDTRQKQE
jgi:hypothetical protein